MNRISKTFAFLLKIIIAISCLSLLAVKPANAQSTPTPSVPEFTLRYVDKSYDVASTTTSSTDPYTSNITTTTIPGRHVSDQTIEVTIKNDLGASYYDLRYKGHYSDTWTYFPYGPSHNIYDGFFPPHFQASNSSYTVGYLPLDILPQPIPQGAPIDVQVQPLFGDFEVTPYGFAIGRATYDARFTDTADDWTTTQTITIGETSASPSPTVPEFPITAVLCLLVALPLLATILLKKKRKLP